MRKGIGSTRQRAVRSASGSLGLPRISAAWLSVALALGWGPSPLQAQAGDLKPSERVMLRTGDAVRLEVWRQPDLSGEFLVLPDGRLAHPLLQAVRVTDVRFLDAKERMRTVLERYDAEPQFVMEPLLRVIVGGEVQRPDRYLLPPETDIAQAVAMAGGFTELGRRERVRLFRDNAEMMFDVGTIESGAQQMLVQSGDQIMVDRRSTAFRDYIAPIGGLLGGIASVISVIIIAGK